MSNLIPCGKDKFSSLHVGSITPGGWMSRHMKEDANGWVRITDAMSRAGIWSLYSDPEELKAPFYQPFLDRKGTAGCGEFQAHWLDAVTWLGYVGGSRECRTMAQFCVEDLIAHQAPDGYIGVASPQDQFCFTGQDGNFEMFCYGETLTALLNYYHHTNDPAVLEACVKAANLVCSEFGPNNSEGKNLKRQIWPMALAAALAKLYRYTGDSAYLDTALQVVDDFFNGSFDFSFGTILREKKPLGGHTAGWGATILAIIELYRSSGDQKWLEYTIHAHESLVKEHLLPHGAPSGMGECLAGVGPYVDTEFCDTFWWIWCWTELLKLTGDPKYADFAEKAALNALPGQRSKDGLVLCYFMTSNQIVALQAQRNFYSARMYVECCHSNAPRTLPLMAENMVLATPDGGLALAFYGAGEARCMLPSGASVVIRQESEYPFGDTVEVSLSIDKSKAAFPLLVRIPAWSQGASISINGTNPQQDCPAGTWVRLEREWNDGDRVTLRFPAKVQVNVWEHDGQRAAVLERGPLVYALPVRGDRQMLDVWGTFELRAAEDSAWNYALLLDAQDPASSVAFKRLETTDNGKHLWESPPVALEVRARRIPDWKFDAPAPSPGLQGRRPTPPSFLDVYPALEGFYLDVPRAPKLPEEPFPVSDEIETIQLVPYGFTLLRMTYLPVVDQ